MTFWAPLTYRVLVEIRLLIEEVEEEVVSVGRERRGIRGGVLHVGTTTGKAKEFADMMQRKQVDIGQVER